MHQLAHLRDGPRKVNPVKILRVTYFVTLSLLFGGVLLFRATLQG